MNFPREVPLPDVVVLDGVEHRADASLVDVAPVDTALGFDVNDFDSTVVYGIFNDPDADDIRALPEALRPRLVDVPLLEDESLTRVVDHARLMNEDRARMVPPRDRVIIKTQTILRTPYRIVEGWE